MTPDRLRQVGRVSVVAPASGRVVSLEDAKEHLRVTHNKEDKLIQRAIGVAETELVFPFGWLGRSLLSQQLLLTLDAPPPHVIYLGGPPVISVDNVEYTDTDGTNNVIAGADYQTSLLDTGQPAMLWPSVTSDRWPAGITDEVDAFRVTYTAGYASADDVPLPIVQWMLIRISELYQHREGTVLNIVPQRLKHIDNMLENFRVR